jgi:hypothetical protein
MTSASKLEIVIPFMVLDWDYDTFDVEGDDGEYLYLYDVPEGTILVFVSGWLWCGKHIDETLYEIVGKDNPFYFHRVEN